VEDGGWWVDDCAGVKQSTKKEKNLPLSRWKKKKSVGDTPQ
jgi:hypothetical protein